MKYLAAAAIALFSFSLTASAEDKKDAGFEGYSKFVKDDVHVELNADATYTETTSYQIKVLNKDAIDELNKQYISYSNSLSDIEIVEAYTLKADGKKVPVPAGNFQVETNTGDKGNAPIISDITTKTIVFPDVGVGDTIAFTYKLKQKEALFPNQFSYTKTYINSYVYEESEFSITAPESLPLRVEARGVKGGEEAKSDGKRHWVWHYENHDLGKPSQQTLVSSFDYGPRVLASTFKDYAELAAAYESRAEPKAAITDRIKALAADLTKDAKNDLDASRMLYDWVAKNIRYAGNCIGIGSVVPHDTDHILDNKIGDCKDHTALLQALLAAKGIDSTPALVNSGTIYTLPDLPVAGIFNHVINYIPSLDLYADSTSEVTPFGSLSFDEEGKFNLHTKGFEKATMTPPTNALKQWGTSHTEITFNDDGSADGTVKVTRAGHFAEGMEMGFEALKVDSRLRESTLRGLVTGSGFKGTAEFTSFDDVGKRSDSYSYALKFHLENALNLPGPGATYIYPYLRGQGVAISDFLNAATHETPQHDFPCFGGASTEEIVFHLPKSVKIMAVPKNLHLTWKYGIYDSVYKQKGNMVTSMRKVVDTTPGNVCAPQVDEIEHAFAGTAVKDLKSQLIYN